MAGCAIAAFLLGGFGGCVQTISSSSADRSAAEEVPLPHHVPKYPAGLSFRFAMAHDVIHERYTRQGPALLRERERLTRAKLAELDLNDKTALALMDDLAAALHRLGRSMEAIDLMQDKLARQ